MRLTGFLLIATVGLVGTPVARCETPEQDVVSRIEGDSRPFTVVSTVMSDDRKELTITLRSERGIFGFQFRPPDAGIRTVRFVMEKEQRCEGFTFSPPARKQVELVGMEGFKAQPRGGDLSIEITGAALAVLKVGGRIPFVNAYR
ncbi:MAG: hypothetical protein V4819_01220 [Verrucomicrobiota bacterium]